ncbi:uncharacterized protein LOC111461334 [Cucurbita moschata]|uniref:Uncharacterized protein LOC111461334 n=1 Tax=Cucurbita moschata TaxID=3662 RepID=A0A6J1H9J3_CUCMO|nr:uncharacterized protein LOC111461334 [Cucurbita moschata]
MTLLWGFKKSRTNGRSTAISPHCVRVKRAECFVRTRFHKPNRGSPEPRQVHGVFAEKKHRNLCPFTLPNLNKTFPFSSISIFNELLSFGNFHARYANWVSSAMSHSHILKWQLGTIFSGCCNGVKLGGNIQLTCSNLTAQHTYSEVTTNIWLTSQCFEINVNMLMLLIK